MKDDIEFAVKLKGNNIVFEEKKIKTMNLMEASKDIYTLRGQLAQLQKLKEQSVQEVKDNITKGLEQLEKQKENMKKNLNDKLIRKNLDKTSMDFEKLIPVEQKWNKLIKPLIDDIRKKIKTKVKKAKKKCDYDDLTAMDVKIVEQNNILAPLCEEFQLEMTHPIIMEIKRDFEKI